MHQCVNEREVMFVCGCTTTHYYMQDEVKTRRYGWRAVLKAMKIEGTHKSSEVEIKILPVNALSKAKQVKQNLEMKRILEPFNDARSIGANTNRKKNGGSWRRERWLSRWRMALLLSP